MGNFTSRFTSASTETTPGEPHKHFAAPPPTRQPVVMTVLPKAVKRSHPPRKPSGMLMSIKTTILLPNEPSPPLKILPMMLLKILMILRPQ